MLFTAKLDQASSTAASSGTPNGAGLGRLHDIMRGVRCGDAKAMEDLRSTLHQGIRWFLVRKAGPENADDKVQEVLLAITGAVQNGSLSEPEQLLSYARTASLRVAGSSDLSNPDRVAPDRGKVELMERVLQELPEKHRQILIRFYSYAQSAEEICREMNMTEPQFTLLKSSARTRFDQLGRERLAAANPKNS